MRSPLSPCRVAVVSRSRARPRPLRLLPARPPREVPRRGGATVRRGSGSRACRGVGMSCRRARDAASSDPAPADRRDDGRDDGHGVHRDVPARAAVPAESVGGQGDLGGDASAADGAPDREDPGARHPRRRAVPLRPTRPLRPRLRAGRGGGGRPGALGRRAQAARGRHDRRGVDGRRVAATAPAEGPRYRAAHGPALADSRALPAWLLVAGRGQVLPAQVRPQPARDLRGGRPHGVGHRADRVPPRDVPHHRRRARGGPHPRPGLAPARGSPARLRDPRRRDGQGACAD